MKLAKYITVFSVILFISGIAEAGLFNGKSKPAGCCETVDCPPCNYTCCPEVKTEKVKKHCWKTECEPICIPKVHCPLFNFFRKDNCNSCTEVDACGQPLSSLCGKIRVVKKLKKVEYECEKCVVEWNVRCISDGCGKCCDSLDVPGGCCQIR